MSIHSELTTYHSSDDRNETIVSGSEIERGLLGIFQARDRERFVSWLN